MIKLSVVRSCQRRLAITLSPGSGPTTGHEKLKIDFAKLSKSNDQEVLRFWQARSVVRSLETIPDFGPLIDAIQPVWPIRLEQADHSRFGAPASTFAINLADPAISDFPGSQEPQRSR